LIFHADSTPKHPHKQGKESINMINFIDITCEDRFPEVLKFKKSNHPSSGSTTPLSDSLPSLTHFETSGSLLEEFADKLALLDPFPSGKEGNKFNFEADLREIEYLLNHRMSLILRLLTSFSRSSPTNLLSITYLHREMTMMIFLTLSLITMNGKSFCMLLDNDSTVPEESSESSEIASLFTSPFRNEDRVFNPGILILDRI
nr:hypothetical protein [Tanacetum cinerariifolium]